MNLRNRSTSADRALRAAAGAEDTGSQAHDEWLLDEALMETFPASDPTAPAIVSIPPPLQRPGSRASATFRA
ncbi:MAG: hypothetical protein LT103_08790 [Burkholderiaceae bacterium]|jgi:hypothetical protein|nr:hypothetical protein [Burkholderiaceae bacterium]ODS96550.1 MAG: hypothetical protein ABS56_12780 [Lautropia sp. SCN 69-89]